MQNGQKPYSIASTYEIVRELGSGGGGIVYLAKHLRLGKLVVLKADKRSLTAKPAVLRREVDALKNLSHTYIPQVYDFVSEGDMVYTVMDYIEGESLDKPLRRGERFEQKRVIKWACQLLEALCYLHSRPPHGILHSDIKPANVMLTPEDNICLIDFNIALALGEEGAVRVGFSRGYASPEHYGIDYSAINQTRLSQTTSSPSYIHTILPTNGPETVLQQRPEHGSSSASSRRSVLLDVRSDIYSLGATLYHILTGTRPAQDADKVEPINDPSISPAVAEIIAKAMSPDPKDRYQSADEMLFAFTRLRENDQRTKRYRKQVRITAAVLAALLLTGGALTIIGSRQMEREQEQARIAAEQAEKEARLAEEKASQAKEAAQRAEESLAAIAKAETAYRDGDVAGATAFAVQALELDTPYAAQAQKALTDALGVYDLSDGYHSHLLIQLPSEPLKAVLSPEGTRAAVVTSGELVVYDTQSGVQLATLQVNSSALSDVVFVDETRILYAGADRLEAYDLDTERALWSAKAATGIALSADRTTVAAVHTDENLAAIYDAQTGTALRTVAFHEKQQNVVENDVFADPDDNLFALNADGTMLAVSFADGALTLFDLRSGAANMKIFDTSEFVHFEGGFFGQYFAFSATGSGNSVFVVIDTENKVQTGGFSSTMPFHVRADESGVYVSTENVLVKLDPVTGDQTEVAYTQADITAFDKAEGYTITATADGAVSLFDHTAKLIRCIEDAERGDFVRIAGKYAVMACRDTPMLRVLKLENHQQAQLLSYDASYTHSEARVSADGNTVMLFRYDGFRIYAINGKVLAEVAIPDAQQVYDQQYRRDEAGSRLEVIYNSGRILTYSAADGSLLADQMGAPPDETLYEEFFTDRLRITSPLHGTPVAYDKDTGELVSELESRAYLTYVTQVGEYVITEYITAEAERYGLLLNGNCQTLAYLPWLCDVTNDGRLIFDDMSGNLRESRIYSIEELIALATK